MHRITLFGYDDEGREALERLGLSVRPSRKGSAGWRYETATADFGQVVDVVERIQSVLDVAVRFTARLAHGDATGAKARNWVPFMPASAVRPGMAMVTDEGRLDCVVSVEPVVLGAPVYDLDIAPTHNFAAEG